MLTITTPRMAIQTAFQVELVDDGHVWLDALQKRNLMAHTYNKDLAQQAETLIRTQDCRHSLCLSAFEWFLSYRA